MKTLSVREVADALGMTPRGVVQRLNRGQLKGTKKQNQFGIQEWQVYANREIMQAIESKKGPGGETASQQSFDFAPDGEDTVDAEGIAIEDDEDGGPSKWRDIELARLEVLAEKLVKPLTERLEYQAGELRDKERQLEEQGRQLRLLPDLEKRAEAERRAAELKALEVEALNKQIAALDEQRQAAEAEAERIKSEKEAEAKAIQEQLAALSAQLQELKQPKLSWWQKWFATGE
jgi:DNA repair exonuclease SbcCD ATPase subunit